MFKNPKRCLYSKTRQAVLKIRAFQLTSNYEAEAKACKSFRRHVKGQLEVWRNYEARDGAKPPKKSCLFSTHSDNMAINSAIKKFKAKQKKHYKC